MHSLLSLLQYNLKIKAHLKLVKLTFFVVFYPIIPYLLYNVKIYSKTSTCYCINYTSIHQQT